MTTKAKLTAKARTEILRHALAAIANMAEADGAISAEAVYVARDALHAAGYTTILRKPEETKPLDIPN